ncbi:MAG: hypothetical protein WBD31_27905 [Rubripirellula sp.]
MNDITTQIELATAIANRIEATGKITPSDAADIVAGLRKSGQAVAAAELSSMPLQVLSRAVDSTHEVWARSQ